VKRINRIWGHPLKGPCQEEKVILCEKIIFSLNSSVELPASPPLPKLLSIVGVSLYCTSHPSGLRSLGLFRPMEIKSKLRSCETPKISQRSHPILSGPFPLKADQKIFGSRPCPNDFCRSRGYEPTPRWLTAWAAKMRIPYWYRGGTGSQSGNVVPSQPHFRFAVRPHS
jgi:hypothetical protein